VSGTGTENACSRRPGDGLQRGFDLILVVLAAPVWAPLLGALCLLTLFKMGSPVFFRQQRPGRDGRPFVLLKVRTMREACDDRGERLPDEQRLTRFGRFLRSTSLDELPGIWNVIRGEMSLVGPRPLLMEYLPLYTPEQARRHQVKPGITGWAQVNGRNRLSWDEKFALDVWYVDHRSLVLDLRILLLTAVQVLRREGISHQDDETMPRFEGSLKSM
jgi:lipopolysaccharide/colanic/teichoic acid biosynthesis glycosyltransferase